MQNFQKLARNIFFKIFIGILLLSFAFFGVSNFILNSSGSYVAKIGGKTISYQKFTKALQSDRESIMRANAKNPEAVRYVESAQFKSDVLSRLVNQMMMDKLRDNFEIEASKKIIFEGIATNPQFRKDGKFDREVFRSFLAQNGFDEEKYFRTIQDEIVGTMILSSLAIASPIDEKLVAKIVDLKEEKRIADVIKISTNNVGNIATPDAKQLEEYFAANKSKFIAPEIRTISYATISATELNKNVVVSEQEIAKDYEKNKENYKNPERRSFYQIMFMDQEKADKFLSALNNSKEQNKAKAFEKLAKEMAHKSLKEISMIDVKESNLIPDIAKDAFKTPLHAVSPILKSPLGLHIFLTNEIKPENFAPLSEVRNVIKQNILQIKSETIAQEKVSEIEDNLLTANSLSDVAKKFNLNLHHSIKITQDEKSSAANEIKDLNDFVKNSFALQENQISKLYFSEKSGIFYAIKVEKIEKSHEKKLAEVKNEVLALYNKEKKLEKLYELARKISAEIIQNPSQALQIAAKNQLKVERNKPFSRFIYVEVQGQKVPYSNQFLEEIFAVKIGGATRAAQTEKEEFNIAIVREIKKSQITQNQVALGKAELVKDYRQESMQAFNKFLQQKYPIKINDKFLGEIKQEK